MIQLPLKIFDEKRLKQTLVNSSHRPVPVTSELIHYEICHVHFKYDCRRARRMQWRHWRDWHLLSNGSVLPRSISIYDRRFDGVWLRHRIHGPLSLHHKLHWIQHVLPICKFELYGLHVWWYVNCVYVVCTMHCNHVLERIHSATDCDYVSVDQYRNGSFYVHLAFVLGNCVEGLDGTYTQLDWYVAANVSHHRPTVHIVTKTYSAFHSAVMMHTTCAGKRILMMTAPGVSYNSVHISSTNHYENVCGLTKKCMLFIWFVMSGIDEYPDPAHVNYSTSSSLSEAFTEWPANYTVPSYCEDFSSAWMVDVGIVSSLLVATALFRWRILEYPNSMFWHQNRINLMMITTHQLIHITEDSILCWYLTINVNQIFLPNRSFGIVSAFALLRLCTHNIKLFICPYSVLYKCLYSQASNVNTLKSAQYWKHPDDGVHTDFKTDTGHT